MKAISDVIAMLLMLVITIGLVGLAYSYISGVFTARTAVVLSIDAGATTCMGNTITVFIRNDGTQSSGSVSVTLYNATGYVVGSPNPCPITNIPAGGMGSCTITKTGGAGFYRIVATSAGASASGQVYCVS